MTSSFAQAALSVQEDAKKALVGCRGRMVAGPEELKGPIRVVDVHLCPLGGIALRVVWLDGNEVSERAEQPREQRQFWPPHMLEIGP